MLFGFGNLFVTQPSYLRFRKEREKPETAGIEALYAMAEGKDRVSDCHPGLKCCALFQKKTREKRAYEESGHKIVECLLGKMLNAKC